jgi:hypothetical protein
MSLSKAQGFTTLPHTAVTAGKAIPYHDRLVGLAARSNDPRSSLAAASHHRGCLPCVVYTTAFVMLAHSKLWQVPADTCHHEIGNVPLHSIARSYGIPQAVCELARQCVVQQGVLLRGVDKRVGRIRARVPQAHPQRKCVLHGLHPQQWQNDGEVPTVQAVGYAYLLLCRTWQGLHVRVGSTTRLTHFDDSMGSEVASGRQPQWVAIQDVQRGDDHSS